MCSGLATRTGDMTIDNFDDALTPAEIVACNCQGTDAAAASFETAVCGGARLGPGGKLFLGAPGSVRA